MARYDVRNDGIGPYAVFYCDRCSREYRTQPDVKSTIQKEVGRSVLGGFLRNIPILGSAVANSVMGQDPRYQRSLEPAGVESAWKQVADVFHECPTCHQLVCNSDWDAKAGVCADDSPRRGQMAEAQAEQAAGVVKGLASAFGLGEALKNVGGVVKGAAALTARCPKDGTVAPPGTKFCPECGAEMVQPVLDACPKCKAPAGGARFCPQCGTKIERAAAPAPAPEPATCPSCGAEAKGAKFCPGCGAKLR